MTAIHRAHSAFDRTLSAIAGPLAGVFRRWSKIWEARKARASINSLLTRDDRLLSDIGVARSDIERALSVHWSEDPAAALAETRRRRRQADLQARISHRAK